MPCFGSHHWSSLSRSKTANADEPGTLSPLHFPSEETGELDLQGARCVPSCSGGRNHNETWEGCIVSWTTTTKSSCSCSKSTSWRKVALKAARVRSASYLRR